MRTADFLPPQEFATHVERRKTPRRMVVLGIFTLVTMVGALAVNVEAAFQESAAISAEAPNDFETQAGHELREIYGEMNTYVASLDPLSDHLQMPASGRMLANLASAVGNFVQIEKFTWEHDVRRKGATKIDSAEMHVVLTCLVRGDRTLLELPERLKEYTGFDTAWIGDQTELVLEMRDTVRAEVHLTGELLLPGMQKPVRNQNR